MIKRRIQPLNIVLKDEDAERARRNANDRIAELADAPAMTLTPLGQYTFANATEVTIAHKLGREPLMFWVSPVRGASSSGRIEEIVSSGTCDRSKMITLKATGFGATVTAFVAVL